MLLIGLTGGIATGKSTASNILRSPPHDLPIIDADLLAREVVEPGTSGYQRIVAYFGDSTPDLFLDNPLPAGGRQVPQPSPADPSAVEVKEARSEQRPLNRLALGRRVFGASPSQQRDRAMLNAIVHPAVRRRIWTKVLALHFRGHWAAVLDVPLLFESGLDVFCGAVLVVATCEGTQVRRLKERNGLEEEEARDRVRSQEPVSGKVERVGAMGGRGKVLVNEGTREELEGRVREVMRELKRGHPDWRVWVERWVVPLMVLTTFFSVIKRLIENAAWNAILAQRKRKT